MVTPEIIPAILVIGGAVASLFPAKASTGISTSLCAEYSYPAAAPQTDGTAVGLITVVVPTLSITKPISVPLVGDAAQACKEARDAGINSRREEGAEN